MKMAESPKPPGVIRFPGARPGTPKLSLPRRRPVVSTRSPFEISEASAEARKQIHDIVSVTRATWADPAKLDQNQASELEKSLRLLEAKLAERERAVAELEARCAERERELAEMEALLIARENLVAASKQEASPKGELSVAEKEALERLKEELERQEESIREAREALNERELFLDESESRLFEKVQAQQEKETELEQREEDLRARERRVREREATHDPEVAAALKSEAARKFDEFSE